jgi:hypothetical protein
LLGGGAAGSTLLNSLVSYWPLNEQSGTRVDAVGDNDLTDNNTVGVTLSGPSGLVTSFVKTDNDQLVNTSAALKGIGSSNAGATLAGWVKISSAMAAGYPLLFGSQDGNGCGIGVFLEAANPGRLYARFVASDLGTTDQISAGDYRDNRWHFIVVWFDPADKKGRISIDNGVELLTTLALGTTALKVMTSFKVGGWDTFGTLDGNIARLGAWERPLTAEERTSLFNSGAGKSWADLTAGEQVGLVSYFNMDEVSGTRYDSHGANQLLESGTIDSEENIGATMAGNAARFVAANNEFLSVASNATLNFSETTGFTFALWLQVPAGGFFAGKDDAGANRQWLWTGTAFYLFDDGGSFVSVSTTEAAGDLGVWRLFCIWYDPADQKLHLSKDNGVVQNSAGTIATLRETNVVTEWGKALGTCNGGAMDELAIWSRVLTADERTELYNDGEGTFYPFA